MKGGVRIGQIGLGAVGIRFAQRLHAWAGRLRVLGLDAGKMRAALGFGAVGARSDVALLWLPGPDAVRAVMLGVKGVLAGAAPGTLVVDTSTLDPWTSEAMHGAAAGKKVGYLDAPVSSGEPGFAGTDAAKAGKFTFLVGGAKADFKAARPVLEALGSRIYHLGPPGSGSIMKLVSNHIADITTWAAAEGLALSAACGVAASKAIDVLGGTAASSYVLDDDERPRVEAGDFEPGFSTDLCHKDLRLAWELGQGVGVPLVFNQFAMEMFQIMRSQGRGGRSHIDCVNYLVALAGVDLRDPPSRVKRQLAIARKH